MLRKDYILRMIEEMVQMITKILGLLKNGESVKAYSIYTEGLQRILKLNEDELFSLDVDKIRFKFENEYGESFLGLENLADLIVKGGDIHIASNDEGRAEKCYIKALELLNVIEMESGIFSLNRQAKMVKVTQLLDQIKNNLN